jgi:hypothetical protein
MQGVLNYFDRVFGAFDAEAKKFAADSPAAINKEVDAALKMAEGAVKGKKHLFFGEDGGINQRLKWAESRQQVFAALSPSGAAGTKAKIDEARQTVGKMKESLSESIVASNTPPKEIYKDADRAELIEIIKAKWAEGKVGGEVLKVGINSKAWRRDTRWEYSNKAWSKVDTSTIQGFVIVKLDDKTAAIWHINIWKDHMAQDTMKAYFVWDPKKGAEVSQKMLVGSVK